MPLTKNKLGRKIWLFSNLSLELATWLGDAANVGLLVCLVGGVIFTFVIVRSTNVKEHHWDVARDQSQERISQLQAESDKARAAIADAKVRVAVAEKQAADANLEILRLKTPRSISAEQAVRITSKAKNFTRTPYIFTVFNDPEATDLLSQIETTLTLAGWVEQPRPKRRFSQLLRVELI